MTRPLRIFPILVFGFSLFCSAQNPASTSGSSKVTVPLPAAADSAPLENGTNPPAMKPEPKISEDEKELFLKTANIEARKGLSEGTTHSERATFSNGKLTHAVHLQFIDIYKPVFRGSAGTIEKNFRDSYKYNIAAYKLAKLLNLTNMVPISVERMIDGKPASATWWLDNIWMTEAQRRDNKIKPPTTQEWVNQLNIIRVFDQLIYNTDRNQGNLLISPEWKVFMIDHTRAFRIARALMKEETLGRCDFNLLKRLKELTVAAVTKEAGPWLRPEEIAGVMARRDLIVRYFESEASKKGEDAVFTDIPRKTPSVSIP